MHIMRIEILNNLEGEIMYTHFIVMWIIYTYMIAVVPFLK